MENNFKSWIMIFESMEGPEINEGNQSLERQRGGYTKVRVPGESFEKSTYHNYSQSKLLFRVNC